MNREKQERTMILSLRKTISPELIVFLLLSPWLVTEIVTNYYLQFCLFLVGRLTGYKLLIGSGSPIV